MPKQPTKEFDLTITISCINETIAKNVLRDLTKALDKIYRDIDFKAEVIEHIDRSNWLKFLEQIKQEKLQ